MPELETPQIETSGCRRVNPEQPPNISVAEMDAPRVEQLELAIADTLAGDWLVKPGLPTEQDPPRRDGSITITLTDELAPQPLNALIDTARNELCGVLGADVSIFVVVYACPYDEGRTMWTMELYICAW